MKGELIGLDCRRQWNRTWRWILAESCFVQYVIGRNALCAYGEKEESIEEDVLFEELWLCSFPGSEDLLTYSKISEMCFRE